MLIDLEKKRILFWGYARHLKNSLDSSCFNQNQTLSIHLRFARVCSEWGLQDICMQMRVFQET